MDAAISAFAERGRAVTLEEIARRSGVSRQSVYVHFGSRTGLLLALVQHVDAGGLLDTLVQRVAEAPSSSGALDALADLHAEYSPVAYPVAKVLMRDKHEDEALRTAWHDRMEGRRGLYRLVVARLRSDELLAPEWDEETAIAAIEVLTSWHAWEHLVIDQQWPADPYRAFLRSALRRILLRREGDGPLA